MISFEDDFFGPVARPLTSAPTFNVKNMFDLESYFSAIHSPRVMNGSDVAQWNNIGANTNNAIQATGANQPGYDAAGLNGMPTLTFNGTSELMTVDSLLVGAGEWDIFTVLESADVGVSRHWFSGRDTASNADALSVYQLSTADPQAVYNGTVVSFNDLTFVVDTPTIVRHTFDGSTLRCYQDGVLSSTTSAASGTVSDITRAIGNLWINSTSLPTAGTYWSGNISELAFFSKIKTDVENNAILSYLSFLYKIPVTLL